MTTIRAAIDYTPVGDDIVATQPGNRHYLTWNAAAGTTVLDRQDHPFGVHLGRHAFEVQAATLFGRLDLVTHTDTAVAHASRGLSEWQTTGDQARFQIPCACGHYRTPPCLDEFSARAHFGAHLIKNGVVPQQRSNP